MKNPIIKFAINWNLKLTNIVFSTIRLKNEQKFKLNQNYDIQILDGLHQNIMGECECIYIKHFKLQEITEPLFLLDMALNKKDGIKMINHLYEDKKDQGFDLENAEFSFMLLQWKPQYQSQIQPSINQILATA
jgi:hypothetical protein